MNWYTLEGLLSEPTAGGLRQEEHAIAKAVTVLQVRSSRLL
jgi:hypothetical protein